MYIRQTSKIVGSVVAGLLLLASAPVLAGVVGDDFNDNDKDMAKWNIDILTGAGTGVSLTETRGRLEFTGEPSSTNVYSIVRPWGAGFGSSTQDWEIAADINLGGVTLSQNGTGIKIFLVVADAANITNNYLTFGLNLERTADVTEFSYETDATYGQSYSRYHLATLNQSDRVSIVYNSSAKTLGVYWSGGAMRADDLLGDNKRLISEWNMTTNSNFVFGLGGGIYGCTNNGQEVWADNFSFTTISTTNRYAGTYSGTYSGDVTGTWQMGIDNSGRILGIAQNGSLGYSISGTVQPDGTLAFVAADNMADFSGTIDASWAVAGTWISTYMGSGVFSGLRMSNPLLPYVVTFDGQGGTAPAPSSTIVTNGLTYGTLATTTREGYTFAGWWTEVNGGGTPVTAETNVTITTAQTLYAKWILDLYAITHFGPQEIRESKPYWPLTFQSVSNNAYVIQVAPTVTGAWLTVSEPLVAVSNRIQVLVRMLESMPQAFYRVCTSTALVQYTYTLGFNLPDQWIDLYDWTTLPPDKRDLRYAADDPDGDGMNNQSEMAAGTDPTDSRSCLRMLSFNVKDALLSGDIQTTTGRIYYVESMWPQGSVWRPITGLIDGQNQKSAWQIPQPPEAQAGLFRAILAVPSEMTINPSLVGPAAVRRPLQ
jgi:uncharacterized repeat protein (TIGR02543 family)